jgi:hypothetical protein
VTGTGDPAPLGFRLRTPVRVSWTSEPVRERWAPRFAALRDALDALDPAASVVAVRPALARGLRDAIARAGMHARPLVDDALGDEPQPAGGAVVTLAIGTRARIDAIVAAASARDAQSLAALTGLPACCLAAAWRGAEFDPAWISASPQPGGSLTVDLPALPETNALLRPLGLRLAPVAACSVRCEAMRQFARARLDGLTSRKRPEAAALLASVLDWPVRWSALHGIAETATPVVRFTYGTLATGRRIAVRYHGTTMPEGAAQGLVFPYRLPARLRAKVGA